MLQRKPITITKNSGEKSSFDESKLRHSLERSGAGGDIIQSIIKHVEASIYEGITTKEIYKKAFALLRKKSRPSAARYNLKKALFDFGPKGFPFENFVAALLESKGFITQTGQSVKGNCVQHEVDVVAKKANKHFMVECKFHSDQKRHCDVKVPLYIQSRFEDIAKQWRKQHGQNNKFYH